MSTGLKLLFDENFGRPTVERLKQFLTGTEPMPTLATVVDYLGGGKDDVWIPMLRDGDWIVITADRGRRSGGAKLPDLCVAYGVTHVLLSKSVHHLPQFEKARAIVAVWSELSALSSSPSGSRHVLRLNGAGHPVLEQKAIG